MWGEKNLPFTGAKGNRKRRKRFATYLRRGDSSKNGWSIKGRRHRTYWD